MLSKLQYISQGETAEEQLSNIDAALNAGCNWIQLRFKNADEATLLDVAQSVKALCVAHGAKLIINDNVYVAMAVDADGVHLGLSDMAVEAAREIVGKEKIIGGTANTFNDVYQRYNEGCDYVGVGPFRFTVTKEKLSPILGADGYQQIISKMDEIGMDMPVYAIGGIEVEDVGTILNTGVYGIAVSGLISKAADKKQIVEQLNSILYATVENS